ncbi:MAG: hypothetical protein H7235_06265 [Bdellovibrionaceae bacterium]|nr:hypothetical protein [Pseudobdellovibrionaceae bacterium]
MLLLKTDYIEVSLIGKTEASEKKYLKNNNLIKTITTSKNRKSEVHKKSNLSIIEIYCLLSKNSSITLSGDIKIQSGHYGEYPNGMGTYVYVRSSQCPDDKYSVLRIDKNNHIESQLDCQYANFEDILKTIDTPVWPIVKKEIIDGEYNFALLGPSQFLTYCPPTGFQLTRRGHFIFDKGMLRNDLGCFLWNNGDELNAHGPVVLANTKDSINASGCFINAKQCIAQLDFTDSVVQKIRFRDSNNIEIDFYGDLKNNTTRSVVQSDAVEQLDTYRRGPTGILNWDYVESLQFPIKCE